MTTASNVPSKADDLNKATLADTAQGISIFHQARALVQQGQHLEARSLLNASIPCPAVAALCKEPSPEHRGFIREAIAAGANLDVQDCNGFSPLDYAVFADDAELREIIMAGLRAQLFEQRLTKSKLRKGYREIMQEYLRPALSHTPFDRLSDERLWPKLRESYVIGLAETTFNASLFDRFKVIPYREFLRAGKIPKSDEGFAREFKPELQIDFVVFFSYRWRGFRMGVSLPDDERQTQYHRTVKAANSLLELECTLDAARLGIWVDYACVDQSNPAPGVAALPMNLAQCNAMISLVDDAYYTRAWCALEVDMIQVLRRSYARHRLYEQRPVAEEASGTEPRWTLSESLADVEVHPSQCNLSFESDRDAIKFLERQQDLLGTSS